MERRAIVGILLIAVVASTMVTYFMQAASEAPLEVLSREVPADMPFADKTTREFSFGLVLRRPVSSLIIDIDSLHNATSKTGDPTADIRYAVELCTRLCRDVGAPFAQQEINVDGGSGMIYDFSDSFSKLAPRASLLSATTVFSLATIGGEEQAFRGVSDYFPNRNRSLASLTLAKNEVPETYLTMEAGEAQSQGKPTIMEAPDLGRKEFVWNEEDDRFQLRIMVNSIGVPPHDGMLQILRVYADTELEIAEGYVLRKP